MVRAIIFHRAFFGETKKLLNNSIFELGRAYIELHSNIRPPLKLNLFIFFQEILKTNLLGLLGVAGVGTLTKGYIRNVPLPRVPVIQSTSSEPRHQVRRIPDYYKGTYVVPMYNSPRSIVEREAFAFFPAWHAIAINN